MLTPADLSAINITAARRFAGATDAVDEVVFGEVAAAQDAGATPFARAAALARDLLVSGVVAAAPLHTALLVIHCSLSLDGYMLLAPQGVTAGMVRALAAGGDGARVARWLEDRAVPASGG